MDSQDVVVTYSQSGDAFELLRSFPVEELAIMLKVSWITLAEGKPIVEFAESPYPRCERSRVRRPDVKEVSGVMLSTRDEAVLRERGELAG